MCIQGKLCSGYCPCDPILEEVDEDGWMDGWLMELGDIGSGCEDENCGPASGFSQDCSNQECQLESQFGLIELVCVTVIYIPLMLFGLLGNILTILVVWLRPHMRSSTYLYLSSMAISDLLILLLLPLDLYKLWRPAPWPLGDLACKLTMFLSECCTFCTILHITFLSLERYLAVCWPITAKTMVTRRRTRALIGCLWLGAIISAAPVLVMVGVDEEGVDGSQSKKIDRRECRCTHYAVTSGLLSAMTIVSNLYFLVPFCILGLVYSLIGRTLWLRPQSSRKDQSQRHTVKMLGVIVLAFVLCWLPFHVGRTIFSFSLSTAIDTQETYMNYLSQYFNLVSSVLFYLSAAVNPLLYNLMSARYRHAGALRFLANVSWDWLQPLCDPIEE
uniref:growth hormone secretagogue receptor type 1-like n=1 Tax=Monopterus albus TaxID=43700 RepID=UPI0009B33CE1|nr:growth hormone secretagogue receptor type 1-like [Monopterus albus]